MARVLPGGSLCGSRRDLGGVSAHLLGSRTLQEIGDYTSAKALCCSKEEDEECSKIFEKYRSEWLRYAMDNKDYALAKKYSVTPEELTACEALK